MPGADCFLDTNILVYAVSRLANEAGKAAIARSILDQRDWAWSGQVAAEFINVTTSVKRAERFTLEEAEKWIDAWLAFPFAPIDATVIKQALQITRQAKISYFDAQIVAAAKQLHCHTLYSEDLNHGQDFGGLKVVNPFRT